MSAGKQLGPAFNRLWVATGVSSIGDGMVLVALPLLALTFTHDALAIAAVAVMGRLPALGVALPAGVLADRLDRRRFAVSIELGRLVVLACFAAAVALHADSLAALYVTAFALGALTTAFDVVTASAVPSMVGIAGLVTANARLYSADVAGEELLGQGIGGVVFGAARSLPFVADAVSFAASAALLRRAIPVGTPRRSGRALTTELGEGLRYFVSDPLLRTLTAVIAALAFCQAMVIGLLPLYGTRSLRLTATQFGIWLAAAGVGGLGGTWLAGKIHDRFGGRTAILLAAGAAVVSYAVLALTHWPVLAGAAVAGEAAAVVVGNVGARTLRQAAVPDEMQGRAASAYQVVALTALPLGSLAGGITGSLMGVRPTFWLASGLQVLAMLVLSGRLLSAGSP